MKTDDLIAALAADIDTKSDAPSALLHARRHGRFSGLRLGAFSPFLGLRQTFFASLDQPRFLFKFIFTLTMAVSGLALAYRLARPVAVLGAARCAHYGWRRRCWRRLPRGIFSRSAGSMGFSDDRP